jgi:diacylglycerol kinase (ATP)
MAVRVDSLGGLFNHLVERGASLHDPHLSLVLLNPPALLSLPLWFLSSWLNLRSKNPFLHSIQVTRFSCLPIAGQPTHFEADGEWLGHIPIEVSLIPNALRILLPRSQPTP